MDTDLFDKHLLALINSGHHDQALSMLFDRYRQLVSYIARQIVRDEGESEDVVQNVFLAIYQSLHLYNSAKGTVETWVLQHTYSRSIDRLRHLNRRQFYRVEELNEFRGQVIESRSSDELLEAKDMIQQALGVLSDRQLRIIELAHIEGHSLREIAECLGEKYDIVRHHYYRGLRKMRVALEELA